MLQACKLVSGVTGEKWGPLAPPTPIPQPATMKQRFPRGSLTRGASESGASQKLQQMEAGEKRGGTGSILRKCHGRVCRSHCKNLVSIKTSPPVSKETWEPLPHDLGHGKKKIHIRQIYQEATYFYHGARPGQAL